MLRALGFVCSADEVGVTIVSDNALKVGAGLTGELPTLAEVSAHVGGILNRKSIAVSNGRC
jgi:hypothetical protein